MTSGTLLFVGDDTCFRVRVLKHVGYTVAACPCDAAPLRDSLSCARYDAILFNCFPEPPGLMLVALCRGLTRAPLVIFADHEVSFGGGHFDTIVPNLCHPQEWLPKLVAIIAAHRSPDEAKPPRAEHNSQDTPRKDHRYSPTG